MAKAAGAGRETAQRGSIPYIRTTNVAHWVEQQTHNLPVAGSNPAVYRLQRDFVKTARAQVRARCSPQLHSS